jgi:RNA 2',3'-cyclic 3'-phosphodiesterase
VKARLPTAPGQQPPMHDERIRLFVALELPRAVVDALVKWRDQVVTRGPGLRPLSADSLHATLCFLGWRGVEEADAIATACGVLSAQGVPVLSLGAPRWLPPRGPRVLAVELVDPTGALTRAQARLADVLAAGGWYQPEKRPYLAHVTVARAGRGARVQRDRLPPLPRIEFQAPRVTLFRSLLLRTGARYQPLAAVELGCSPSR